MVEPVETTIEEQMSKTFYIIDDHEMLRLGTSGWLTSNSDWKCAGDAATHEAALADFEKLSAEGKLPSIVICDINFYGENTGLDFIKQLKALYKDLKIISLLFSSLRNAALLPIRSYLPSTYSFRRPLSHLVFLQSQTSHRTALFPWMQQSRF